MHMKKNVYAAVIALMFLIITGYACAGRYLKTESVSSEGIAGDYTLILYGGNYLNDIRTIAFLAKEGTPYTFEIYAPEFEYRAIKGVSAREALEKAEKFDSFHPYFWKTQLSRIMDNSGNTIGYELRPLYDPVAFGNPDVLRVYYKMTDSKVIVYIRPFFRYPLTSPFEGIDSGKPK